MVNTNTIFTTNHNITQAIYNKCQSDQYIYVDYKGSYKVQYWGVHNYII